MGISYFKSTPFSEAKYLFQDISSLKEEWSSINIFKLKKIFDINAIIDQSNQKPHLTFQKFRAVLPELSKNKENFYNEKHHKRLFDLFNSENGELLSWSNFYIGLTLCYFGSEEILATLMFALFDTNLSFKLEKVQLEELLLVNCNFFKEEMNSIEFIDEETVLEGLLMNRKVLELQTWINQSGLYIDFNQFRKLFNVFIQEEMQKEMALDFNAMNNLYNEEQDRYIGYLVNYKWFQSWKTYIYKHQNIEINGFSQNITYIRTAKSLKSSKTKKSFKNIKSSKTILSSKSKKLIETPKMKRINLQSKNNEISFINQYNLISNNIGDKPLEIYNNILEGEYMEILMPELIQNVDYIIVSEEIWRRLKFIYAAYPEFRRTGKKNIEIYPKNFRIYTKFHKGRIDYNQEKICQFSNYMQMGHLISKINDINIEDLKEYNFFYKTFNLTKWMPLENLNQKVYELSSEQIIFLSIVPLAETQDFITQNCKNAQQIHKIHLGDEFLYLESGRISKKAIFLGKNKDKMIIHIKGSLYIYDICVDKEQFQKNSSLLKKSYQNNKINLKAQEFTLLGLPQEKGFGFVSCFLLTLLSNEKLRQKLLKLYEQQLPKSLLQYLSYLAHMLSNKNGVPSIIISDMMRIFFLDYVNFQITMCQQFIEEIMHTIYTELEELEGEEISENPIVEYLFELQKVFMCTTCSYSSSDRNRLFQLTLPIMAEEVKYYEILFIPFAFNFQDRPYKKYGFKLSIGTTFKEYKQAFEKVSEVSSNGYVLVQVHCNNIIKNYINAVNEITLEELSLREDDKIYAYELCFDLKAFVNDHYVSGSIKNKNFKLKQLIDFQIPKAFKRQHSRELKSQFQKKYDTKNDKNTMWTFGIIRNINIEPYTRNWYIEVEHRINRFETITTIINPEQTNTAIFPTRSFEYADHYHLKMLNRIYNEVTHEMQLCNIPLVIMIANWMRLKELEIIVYQQLKGLITDQCLFKVEGMNTHYSDGQMKIGKKEKIKKFKEYLYEEKKPYRLVFTDFQGRCSVCCKIQKSKISEDEWQFLCEGCPLSSQIPIFWQIRPYQTRLCIDWKHFDAFLKPQIVEHESYFQTKTSRKNYVCQINECILYRNKVLQGHEECLCDDSDEKDIQYKEIAHFNPQKLIFVFDRLSEEGKYKYINKKHVFFHIDEMEYKGQIYELIAAIAIEGSQFDNTFITYIREKGHWLEYKGEHVRTVKKTSVQKMIAICLQYRKSQKRQDQK